MSTIRHISSLEDPDLRPYQTLRRPLEHFQEGIFVAEGEKVVRRLLCSDLDAISMLMTPEWYERLVAEHVLGSQDGPGASPLIFLGKKELLESVVGFNLHQGIMAVAKVPAERTVPEILTSSPSPHLLVALDGLVNAENIGVVVRNCGAFGVQAIIVGETSGSPYLRRAVRNSMGAVFRLPVVHVANLARTLEEMSREHAIDIIGTEPAAYLAITKVHLDGSVCLVVGNEGSGISPSVRSVCTAQAAIPMLNGSDSLNVANATAVILYEACRQRAFSGAH